MDLLFPKRCIGCDDVLPAAYKKRGYCKTCAEKMVFISGRTCKLCGKMLPPGDMTLCRDCEKRENWFAAGKALFLYEEPMKKSMYRFKYSNRRCYAKVYADIAAVRYRLWIRDMGVQAIVPVPMFKAKEKKRGYNQAQVFAEELGRRLNLPVEGRLLLRKKNTSPQKELGNTSRNENLKNAFKMEKCGVKFDCILLVDDIYTTGATMNYAAKALSLGGIKKVVCLCVCIGSYD